MQSVLFYVPIIYDIADFLGSLGKEDAANALKDIFAGA